MKCSCNKLTELSAEEAQKYIDEHLQLLPFSGKTTNLFYKCPLTALLGIPILITLDNTDYNGLVRKANKC